VPEGMRSVVPESSVWSSMVGMPALPKFKASPVVEVVLGVQFSELPITSAHMGWYWRDRLVKQGWDQVNETKPLDPISERFGGEPEWVAPGIRISDAPSKLRLQFVSDTRMIQIQDSRFYYNWRRAGEDYPSFDRLLPEFEQRFEEFRAFTKESGVTDSVVCEYWDVTYVNHIPIGMLWDRGQTWQRISHVLFPPVLVDSHAFDTGKCEWAYLLGGSKGRLRVSAQHARTQGDKPQEVINLQLLARGPVENNDYRSGLRVGHDHLVMFFASLLSPEANEIWERSR